MIADSRLNIDGFKGTTSFRLYTGFVDEYEIDASDTRGVETIICRDIVKQLSNRMITTSPLTRTDVQCAIGVLYRFQSCGCFQSSGLGGNVELRRSRGTAAAPTLINSGDTIGSLVFQGHNGSIFRTAAGFPARASEEWSTLGQGTELTFGTNANGEVGDATDRLKIKSNGQMELYLRLNAIVNQSSGNPAALLNAATY